MKITVMNQKQAEWYSFSYHKESTVVISITSRGGNEAFILPNNANNIKEVLHIKFNDTDRKDAYYGCIEENDAQKIVDFINKYKDDNSIDSIIVHCEAGQSRSAGVAAAILKYLYNDDTQIFNNKMYTPNMLCYREVLNKFMEG